MNFLQKIFGKLTGQVRVKELVAIRVLGEVYPLVMTTQHGRSEKYRTTYTIQRGKEYIEIEEMDVQEFISGYIWVPEDSLEGILSKVSFDPEKLRTWK